MYIYKKKIIQRLKKHWNKREKKNGKRRKRREERRENEVGQVAKGPITGTIY